MSRIYDNWEKLVGVVLNREELRGLALCEIFSSSISTDFSSRPSFDSVALSVSRASSQKLDRSYLCSPSSFFLRDPKVIEFEEIRKATNNFQPDMILEEDGSVIIFKGWIHEHYLTAVKPGFGTAVAVHRLLYEGLVACLNEIYYLSELRHPNLVKLIGYCFDMSNNILVYESTPRGSLDNHLFGGGHQVLPWATRIKVALGAATALAFLHGLEIPLIHRDFKSDNISRVTIFSWMMNYDNWDRLVEAVLRREKDRHLAYCESLSTCYSADMSTRFSFDSVVEDADFSFNLPADIDEQMDESGPSNWDLGFHPFNEMMSCIDKLMDGAEWSNWDDGFQPLNDMMSVSRSPRQNLHPSQLCSENMLFFCDVMAIEYEEIKKATKNFQPELLLGEGGFGPVFKGWLHEHYLTAVNPGSGTAVAVKKLNKEGLQGHNEWVNEIHYLRQIHHPNTIKLIGYSFETDNKIVVYEFMPKGSLNNHLFTSRHHSLPWATRMKVAVGAARAVAFLHGLEIPVIHRNIKSGDFLLDADFNPKLSDFGHAIYGPTGGMTHVETTVMGTYGYAAPEYMETGNLTTRCDVYGFGVVLLELLSGLRVIDTRRPAGEHNLTVWAKPYLGSKRKLSRIMDSRLKGKYPPKEAYKVAKIGLQCMSSDPRLRPTMVEVVAALEKL